MRTITVFIFFLFSLSICGQATFMYYKTDTVLVNHPQKLTEETFYNTTDAKELLFYIKSSEKKYKLVFTFTDWCKPCREQHPGVLALQKDYHNLDVFYLTDIYNARGFISTERYLKEIGNSSPVFSLGDNAKMKNSKGKHQYFLYNTEKKKNIKVDRYNYYINNLVPQLQYYGYALLILYDENDKPVYASTFKETDEQTFNKIKNIITN